MSPPQIENVVGETQEYHTADGEQRGQKLDVLGGKIGLVRNSVDQHISLRPIRQSKFL